jgi:hypothetical protein
MKLEFHNSLQHIKEYFWKFYFFPIICSLAMSIFCVYFKIYYDWLLYVIILAPFSIYNLLFFVLFGKRERHFHGGTE